METEKNVGLGRYISKTEAWALSIGCAVGWGAFVMPGTTFLPLAGPVGTALGMLVGAAVMLIFNDLEIPALTADARSGMAGVDRDPLTGF